MLYVVICLTLLIIYHYSVCSLEPNVTFTSWRWICVHDRCMCRYVYIDFLLAGDLTQVLLWPCGWLLWLRRVWSLRWCWAFDGQLTLMPWQDHIQPPPSVTHIYTGDQIAPSDLVSKQEVLFPSSHFDPDHWYLSYFCFHPIIPCEEGFGLQPSNISFYYVAIFLFYSWWHKFVFLWD